VQHSMAIRADKCKVSQPCGSCPRHGRARPASDLETRDWSAAGPRTLVAPWITPALAGLADKRLDHDSACRQDKVLIIVARLLTMGLGLGPFSRPPPKATPCSQECSQDPGPWRTAAHCLAQHHQPANRAARAAMPTCKRQVRWELPGRLVRNWSADGRRSLDHTGPSRTGRRASCDHDSPRRPSKVLISAARLLTIAA
jgi:hypothetical protein